MKDRNKGNVLSLKGALLQRSYREIVGLEMPNGSLIISIVSPKRLTIDVFYRAD